MTKNPDAQKSRPHLSNPSNPAVLPSRLADEPGFMQALLAFQYGETDAASQQGFDDMMRIADEAKSKEVDNEIKSKVQRTSSKSQTST